MEKAEEWKRLLERLDCVHHNEIAAPPGYSLELDFGTQLDPKSKGLQAGASVTLTIEGIFVNINDGTSRTYIGLDQVNKLVLTKSPSS